MTPRLLPPEAEGEDCAVEGFPNLYVTPCDHNCWILAYYRDPTSPATPFNAAFSQSPRATVEEVLSDVRSFWLRTRATIYIRGSEADSECPDWDDIVSDDALVELLARAWLEIPEPAPWRDAVSEKPDVLHVLDNAMMSDWLVHASDEQKARLSAVVEQMIQKEGA